MNHTQGTGGNHEAEYSVPPKTIRACGIASITNTDYRVGLRTFDRQPQIISKIKNEIQRTTCSVPYAEQLHLLVNSGYSPFSSRVTIAPSWLPSTEVEASAYAIFVRAIVDTGATSSPSQDDGNRLDPELPRRTRGGIFFP